MKYCPNCKTFKTSETVCEDCGTTLLEKATRTCPECGKTSRIDLERCYHCNHEFEPDEITAQIKMQSNKSTNEAVNDTGFQYKTLLSHGKFISGVGWLVAIIGVISVIIGVGQLEALGFMAVLGGIITLIMGVGFIASGQLISCFVSIERNTRATYELLKRKG